MKKANLLRRRRRVIFAAVFACVNGVAFGFQESLREDNYRSNATDVPGSGDRHEQRQADNEARTRLRVMTYNIRYASFSTPETSWNRGLPGGRSERVTAQIRSLAPDVVGMQEVLPVQLADLAAGLSGYEHYSIGRQDGRSEGEACSIFWRAERFYREDAGTFWLSASPMVPGSRHPDAACVRIASWVRLVARGGAFPRRLTVLNTHWDHESEAARLAAADQLRAWVASQPASVPLVVLGDFNADETSDSYRRLTATNGVNSLLVDCFRAVHPVRDANEATFNGFRRVTEGNRIDFVFRNHRLREVAATIVRPTADVSLPSDHYPVLIDLEAVAAP